MTNRGKRDRIKMVQMTFWAERSVRDAFKEVCRARFVRMEDALNELMRCEVIKGKDYIKRFGTDEGEELWKYRKLGQVYVGTTAELRYMLGNKVIKIEDIIGKCQPRDKAGREVDDGKAEEQATADGGLCGASGASEGGSPEGSVERVPAHEGDGVIVLEPR
jgi:hypothetical protein